MNLFGQTMIAALGGAAIEGAFAANGWGSGSDPNSIPQSLMLGAGIGAAGYLGIRASLKMMKNRDPLGRVFPMKEGLSVGQTKHYNKARDAVANGQSLLRSKITRPYNKARDAITNGATNLFNRAKNAIKAPVLAATLAASPMKRSVSPGLRPAFVGQDTRIPWATIASSNMAPRKGIGDQVLGYKAISRKKINDLKFAQKHGAETLWL